MSALAERVERLRSIELFSTLDDEALALVASLASEIEVPAGRVLTEPKQAGTGMFAIEEGRATVETRGGVRHELGPGECFGEVALLTDHGGRTARVSAQTDLRCLAIARDDFRDMLELEPRIAIALLETMAARFSAVVLGD
jgi:CRP-like cAMP-binding protein